jgi:hypothetical protein
VNRAELGALRDAIDTILSWPDPVRDPRPGLFGGERGTMSLARFG